MFVRIIRSGAEKLIECDGYDIEDQGTHIMIELKPGKGAFSLEKSPDLEIYVMNGAGTTIDKRKFDKGEKTWKRKSS